MAKIKDFSELKRIIKTIVIIVIIDALLIGFGLFWQNDTSLMAIGDALWLAFALQFFVAWMMFVYNQNVLSFVIYGSITFLRMLVGKRPKQDYFMYMQMVEERPIPKYVYIPVFLSSLVLFIAAMISLVIIVG
jgi:hypothetical protein